MKKPILDGTKKGEWGKVAALHEDYNQVRATR